MPGETLYLKAERSKEVTTDEVFLKDVAKIYCADSYITAKVKAIKLYSFGEKDKKRQVFSVLKMIELIQKVCPNVTVSTIGEMDTLVDRINVNKHKGGIQLLKVIFVSGISFFGTAFTIMAFHNDIGINKVFGKVYELVMGVPSANYSILELSYSIGLALGIIIFFNHIGGRRITKDPTPIEVEMRNYEREVNDALVETADREGKTIDVS